MSDSDVRPFLGGEWWFPDDDEALFKCRILVGREIQSLPGFENTEDPQTEEAGFIVLGEVHPDGGIIVGVVGELEGIAVIGGEIFVGIQGQPKGEGASLEIDVIGSSEEDCILVFTGETQGAGAMTTCGGVEFDLGCCGEAWSCFVLLFVGRARVELGVPLGLMSIEAIVERGVEEQSFRCLGNHDLEQKRDDCERAKADHWRSI